MSFLDIVWFILISFVFVAYLMVMFSIISDVFKDTDSSGATKALWIAGLIFLPIITALIYVTTKGNEMSRRAVQNAQTRQAQQDAYIQEVAAKASPADQIEKGQSMLDAGVHLPVRVRPAQGEGARLSHWPWCEPPSVSRVIGPSRRSPLDRLLAQSDAAGLLYGAVVSGAALATISNHATGSTRVALATLRALVVYWLAHVYVHVFSAQLAGGDTRALARRLSSSFVDTSVLLGGLPAIAVYVLATAFGADLSAAVYLALVLLVVLLFAVGYLGAYRAGLRHKTAWLEAAGAGCFGVLIIIMKASLH